MHKHLEHKREVRPQKIKHLSPGNIVVIAFVTILLVSISGCEFTQKTTAPAAEEEMSQPPPVAAATDTPIPSATQPNLEATQWAEQTANAPANQTQQAREAEATQFVLKLTEDAIATATAALNAPVLDELPRYGVDSASGHVAWLHDPVTVSIDGYRSSSSANDYGDLSVKDFVLAADINWDTEYGVSGCGFSLRSDGNTESANQYRVIFTRSTDGHVFFNALLNGKVANYKDLYANFYDPELDWNNGATNHMAIVVRGNSIRIFSNRNLVGEVDLTESPPSKPVLPDKPVKPPSPSSDLSGKDLQEAKKAYQQLLTEYKEDMDKYDEMSSKILAEHNAILNAYDQMQGVYEEGFVGLLAYASSGYSNCQFTNAWLWVIE
ncbi:MAG: hypothetical protein JW908_15865 [Anaerolineales bacterium]|nr:hypothetical protein [Anaerolineales bacterium]